MLFRISFCIVAVLLMAGVALADVPRLINYQGMLKSADMPVTTPTSVIFAIWNAETDGDSLWSEEQTVTPNADGLFGALLGSISPIPDSAFGGDAYISVKVEGDPDMSPRQQIVSVGYAFRVSSLAGAAGGGITGDMIVGNPGGDSVIIEPELIVIRGAGGDEEVICSADNVTYITSGDTTAQFGAEGIIFFGATTADTLNIFSPDGHFVAGYNNTATGDYSSVSGGENNIANGDWSHIGGGGSNTTDSVFSVVCGGYSNIASDSLAVVSGGRYNYATGLKSTIGGGSENTADTVGATIGGGVKHHATGYLSTIGGGATDTAYGKLSTIAGGYRNKAGDYSFVGGGTQNAALEASSAVCGGWWNAAADTQSYVGGGKDNIAGGVGSTVSGGGWNNATGWHSTIGGGRRNQARGLFSVVCGGGAIYTSDSNSALGDFSMIPGGHGNLAIGNYSLAAGLRARAANGGTFTWADENDIEFPAATEANFTAASNMFLTRSTGGVVFVSGIDASGNSTSGVQLAAGGGSWSSLSDRNLKANVLAVDAAEVLDKVAALPVSTWNYSSQDESIRHMGPMAQDLYAAFGLGEDERRITTIDGIGISLAAIQGLYQQNQNLRKENDEIKAKLAEVLARLEAIEKR